jgi:uncharacterized protein YxeA
MKKYLSQKGSMEAIIMICLVLALITALGWIFWQNFIHKEEANKQTDVVVIEKNKTASKDSATQSQTGKKTYVDYRKNGDTTGIVLSSSAAVDKLTNASAELKQYLKQLATSEPSAYTVDRVYGDYAAGGAPGHYAIWGPKDGNGAITEVTGTQNLGMKCSELEAAKVPSELVDGKCYKFDGTDSDAKPYTVNPYK